MNGKMMLKTIGTGATIAVLLLTLAGCPTPFLPSADQAGEPGGLEITVLAPEGGRAESLDFTVVTVEVTASDPDAVESNVVAQLDYDAGTDSWNGAIEGLADGTWIFSAEALDDSTTPVVLYSGTSDVVTIDSASSSNALTIQLLQNVGNVRFDLGWTVADTLDAVDITATRTNFTDTTWTYDLDANITSASVFAVNLPSGVWDFTVDGFLGTTQIYADTFPAVTVVASDTVVETGSLTQTRVTPVEFSVDDSGVFASPISVELSTLTPGSTIVYTTDGTDPLLLGTTYSTAVGISDTTSLRAAATATGLADSPVSLATYNFVLVNAASISVYSSDRGDAVALIKDDGSLWLWGSNDQYKLGFSDGNYRDSPEQLPTGQAWPDTWISVSTGHQHSAGVGSDGSLWSWGYNSNGQLGDGTQTTRSEPVQEAYFAMDWKSVAVGSSHTLAVKTNGELWAWGSRADGRLGDGSTTSFTALPTRIGTGSNWDAVYAGSQFSVARRSDGTLWAWGDNAYEGRLGINATFTNASSGGADVLIPTPVGTTVQLAAWYGELSDPGTITSPATNGGYFDTDNNTSYVYNGSTWDVLSIPTWSAVSLGIDHVLAIKSDGTLWAWGDPNYGKIGNGTTTGDLAVPVQIDSGSWQSVAAGNGHSAAVTASGQLFTWGRDYDSDGRLGLDPVGQTVTSPTQVGTDTDWQSVEAGTRFTVGTRTDGTVWAWGDNDLGSLGDGHGFVGDRYVPDQIGTGSDWASIVSGGDFTLALNDSGQLYAWGANSNGQLGQGDTYAARTPVFIDHPDTPGTTWIAIAAGLSFSAAIDANNELYTWGYNYYGQLGLSDTTDRTAPVHVTFPGGVTWTQIAAGYYHLAALGGGKVYTTGYNNYGSLGDGTQNNRSILQQVGTDSDWSTIRAGAYNTFAIKSTGEPWAWGQGSSGQFADGSTNPSNPTYYAINQLSPVSVGTDTDWASIIPGQYYTAGIKTDGSLWVWGNNSTSGLGLGLNLISTGTGYYGPEYIMRRVGLGTDWDAATISRSGYFGLAIRNGFLYSWGVGYDGELGIGGDQAARNLTYYTHQPVGTDSNWAAISAGDSHVVGLKDDGTIWQWGDQNGLAVLVRGSYPYGPYQPFPVLVIE